MKVQNMIHPNLYFGIQSLAFIAHILKSIRGHVKEKQEKFNWSVIEMNLTVLTFLHKLYSVLATVSMATVSLLGKIYSEVIDISGVTRKPLQKPYINHDLE